MGFGTSKYCGMFSVAQYQGSRVIVGSAIGMSVSWAADAVTAALNRGAPVERAIVSKMSLRVDMPK